MSRYTFRRLFDFVVSLMPRPLICGLLKTFENHPEIALRAGYRLFPTVFDSPLVNPAEIDLMRLESKRVLPGIRIDMQEISDLVHRLADYRHELSPVPWTGDPQWLGTYTAIDSSFLYAMTRHLKPKRFIEVGCGYSSRVISLALRKNREEGYDCKATHIEPFPGWRLDGVDLFGELLEERVENLPSSYFHELGEGDIFFIDTSHVLKTQSDVEYELLHVLPILKSGVHIQIHDIYTPYDQPADCVIGPGHSNYWGFRNEQYALECLLSCSEAFRVTLPLRLLELDHPALLQRVCPQGTLPRAQAFWMAKA